MKLYKVQGCKYKDWTDSDTMFIIALNKSSALEKFTKEGCECTYTRVEYLCERDSIIPTIEPIQELKEGGKL